MEKDDDVNTPSHQEHSESEKVEQPTTPTEMETEETDNHQSRSPSVPADQTKESVQETQLKTSCLLEDSFECPESESARKKLISDALQQEDEFLEYLMSLPAATSGAKEKQQKSQQKNVQPQLMRSISSYSGNVSSGGGAKVGLDHLDNLCKLMEQLGDLREQNSKLQRRVQYLEDLKNLQQMHKQLQVETQRQENQEAAFLNTLQQHRQLSARRHQHRQIVEEIFPSPKREGSEDSLTNEHLPVSANKRNSKCKSMTNSKFRQSLLHYQPRERSRSVGTEEIKREKMMDEMCCKELRVENKQLTKQQGIPVVGIAGGTKAKVSKWTKVKEAFKWEKASVIMLPESKSQDSGIGGGEDTRYLRVPCGDNLLSVSPADSVLSGHSSSACSSGGQSPGYITCQHPVADFTLPLSAALSSSSSSEDLDIDLNLADILADYGPQRSASATDSTGGRMMVQDNRRRSLSQMPEEEDASRRSKSLDGDSTISNSALIARHFGSKDGVGSTGTGKLPHQKAHKTPWGKVKDIIQTRKDSLKKRHRHVKAETGSKSTSEAAPSDHEEGTSTEQMRESSDKEADTSVTKAPPTKPSIEVSGDGTGSRIATTKRQQHKTSTSSLDGHLQASDSPTNRRLTPVLTITLPSTEELRTDQHLARNNSKPPPSPQTEDRHHKISTAFEPATSHQGANGSSDHGITEDTSRHCDQQKRQAPLPRPPYSSAGTSPPAHRRASKWTKVKKAFLTSSTPGRREDEGAGRISSSVPSSPNRNSSFFDEMDTDELSSGEYAEIAVSGTKTDDGGEAEGCAVHKDLSFQSTNIHAEIQKNYEELQQKLSQEFHKKLHGWERMKSSSSGCRGPGDDAFLYHDKGFRRKMEEWERMKNTNQNQGSSNKHRDSVAFHTLDEDNLSPDFRKKLQEWQRIKKSLPAGTTPQSTGETFASGSAVPPHFRKKIAEWQLWRTGSAKSDSQHRTEDQMEDLHRKQQEWERVKATSSSPSPETVTSAPVQDSSERLRGNKTPSPGIVRKDTTGNTKGGGSKKATGSSRSSAGVNAVEAPGSGKEKPEVIGTVSAKSGGSASKVHQKGKSQKEKELQWLEKELHKIEREKQRLEREREKYLERQARLEKMRRAMGSGQREQEVLIQTSTGFFRFHGISEKFTRRLYEWEKARGIGPEESTFALLDPGYRPVGNGSASNHGGSDNPEGLLSRSKSAGSVTNIGTGVTNVGTSSLSLNDVEVLEQTEATTLEDSRAASEPHIRTTNGPEDDEPAAVIVDVEDVIEETAAPLPVTPVVQSQTPVYCYAPEEVTRLIDSSGSDSERESSAVVQRTDSVRTESSYKLLEENIDLLKKLTLKEDICRKLENEIEHLEGKIDDVAKTHKQELQRLRRKETDLHIHSEGEQVTREALDDPQGELVTKLKARIRELQQHQERLLREGETLQDSFAHHSEQQAALAQNLVGKMKQLQEANINMAACDQNEPLQQSCGSYLGQQMDAINLVQDLSTQLLKLAEKLELALAERSREVHNLRLELQDRRHNHRKMRAGQHWFSEEGMSVSMGSLTEPEGGLEAGGTYAILPRQSSEELRQLPSLLTSKVLELKEGLNYLCTASGVSDPDQQNNVCPPWKQETDDLVATATFILKCKNKTNPNAGTGQGNRSDSPTIVQVDRDGNTSPVTCVTITPAFWKRRNNDSGSQTKEHTSWQCDDTKSTDNANVGDTSRGEGISPANRDSFCSALSSTSATSSVCGDEDDVEKDSCNSEADAQEGQTRRAILPTEENVKRKRNISEGSFKDSDQDKSSDNEAKQDDGKDEDAKTISKCNPDESTHEKRIHDRPHDDQDRYTTSSGKYETEVYTTKCGASNNTKQRKLLKTRRVSDTYVGYKRQPDSTIICGEQPLSFEKENSEYNDKNEKSTTSDAFTETSRNVPPYSAAISAHKDMIHEANIREHEKEYGECKSGVTNIHVTENTRTELRQTCSVGREAISALTEEGTSNTNCCPRNLSEPCPVPTPENVFVKTTRKIFSPVRRDSGGKASSVISYVVGETCEANATQVLQETDQRVPATSPVINVLRIQRNENTSNEISINQSRGQIANNAKSPPSWLFTRSRSQSSSPALTRKRVSMSVNNTVSETIGTTEQNSPLRSERISDTTSELHVAVKSGANRNSESDLNKEPELKIRPGKQTVANNKYTEKDGIAKPEKHHNFKNETDSQKEYLLQNNKTNTGDNPVHSSRPATPLPSFPPLPQSPNPNRRDLLKITTKETAPSIRMMIARYNQKLTEQESVRGRSPEISGSGSASPVAWRSPVAERRVRARTEKYQEEVQRVLQQGGTKVAARLGGNKVQKSASEGIIRAPDTSTVVKPERESNSDSTDPVITKQLPVLSNPRSILKSPSAGSIKSIPPVPVNVNTNKAAETVLPSVTLGATATTWTPQTNTTPSPSSPSSPELGLHHSSPPPSRLRALLLQRAKEEFLTRGPGGHSWTSDGGTTSTETPSASVSPEPFWGQDTPGESRKDIIRTGLRKMDIDSGNRSRLSQISVESESSCDGSVVIAGGSGKDTGTVSDEGMLLVKSASAGMINVDPDTYRKFYEQKGAVDQQPSTSDGQDGKIKAQACSRFGISSIASRFRRVKMRRSKDRDGGKMNTVSTLCRQSLLVDLHMSKEGATSEGSEVPGPSTSKSCPSSPVLQRSSSGQKAEPGVSSAPTSWILNPARKIFKPK